MAVVRRLQLRLDLPEIKDPTHLPLLATVTQEIDRLSELEKLHVLGQGNGGTVYKVHHKKTLEVYALKVIRNNYESTVRNQILREIDILSSINSSFVVGCYGIFEKPSGDIAILMEYMDVGSIDHLLKTNGTFSEATIADIARQVLGGLNYLQNKKIVHRDIKPSNLLVNQKMEVKIADFGVSKVLSHSHDPCNTYVGTCAYMSSERFDSEKYGYGYAGDVWSLGLTLMELYMGHYPYLPPGQTHDTATLMWSICFGEPPSLPETASEKFRSFVQCCLQKEPSNRWTVSQLLSHPFVLL